MKMGELYNVDEILRNLEANLLIDAKDYEEKDMSAVLSNVRKRIERNYQIVLGNSKMTDDEITTSPYRNEIVNFIMNLKVIHSNLSGYCHMIRYISSVSINLSNINYLGYTKDNLDAALIALQRDTTQVKATDALQSIKSKISTIVNSHEKRFLVCMIVADNLGLGEIVASIAEIFYLGGKICAW